MLLTCNNAFRWDFAPDRLLSPWMHSSSLATRRRRGLPVQPGLDAAGEGRHREWPVVEDGSVEVGQRERRPEPLFRDRAQPLDLQLAGEVGQCLSGHGDVPVDRSAGRSVSRCSRDSCRLVSGHRLVEGDRLDVPAGPRGRPPGVEPECPWRPLSSRGAGAGQRGRREEDRPDGEHPAAADPDGDRAGAEHNRRHGERVGVDDPLHAAETGVQVPRHQRERRIDNGDVQGQHRGREAHDDGRGTPQATRERQTLHPEQIRDDRIGTFSVAGMVIEHAAINAHTGRRVNPRPRPHASRLNFKPHGESGSADAAILDQGTTMTGQHARLTSQVGTDQPK
jgi:hypothetical protein